MHTGGTDKHKGKKRERFWTDVLFEYRDEAPPSTGMRIFMRTVDSLSEATFEQAEEVMGTFLYGCVVRMAADSHRRGLGAYTVVDGVGDHVAQVHRPKLPRTAQEVAGEQQTELIHGRLRAVSRELGLMQLRGHPQGRQNALTRLPIRHRKEPSDKEPSDFARHHNPITEEQT